MAYSLETPVVSMATLQAALYPMPELNDMAVGSMVQGLDMEW